MTIIYQEHSLDEVLRYFSKDFKTRPGQVVHTIEHFVDPVFRKVIFKFHIEETTEQKALTK